YLLNVLVQIGHIEAPRPTFVVLQDRENSVLSQPANGVGAGCKIVRGFLGSVQTLRYYACLILHPVPRVEKNRAQNGHLNIPRPHVWLLLLVSSGLNIRCAFLLRQHKTRPSSPERRVFISAAVVAVAGESFKLLLALSSVAAHPCRLLENLKLLAWDLRLFL